MTALAAAYRWLTHTITHPLARLDPLLAANEIAARAAVLDAAAETRARMEQPAWIVEIAPDSDEMWAEFEEEQFWAHIQRATDSLHKRGQREPGGES